MEKEALSIGGIWNDYHKNKDNDDGHHYRNILMVHYQDLVRYAAEKIHEQFYKKIELDDLISMGTFGLIEAIESYDPATGVKFESYSSLRIRGSIIDGLRKEDLVPRVIKKRINRLRQASWEMRMHLGREPHREEIIKRLEISKAKYDEIKKDERKSSPRSLDAEVPGDDDCDTLCLRDQVPDENSRDPHLEACRKELKEFLLTGLSREEQLVILIHYYEGMYMHEAGKAIGICESRVSQMNTNMMKRIRARLGYKENTAKIIDLTELAQESSA